MVLSHSEYEQRSYKNYQLIKFPLGNFLNSSLSLVYLLRFLAAKEDPIHNGLNKHGKFLLGSCNGITQRSASLRHSWTQVLKQCYQESRLSPTLCSDLLAAGFILRVSPRGNRWLAPARATPHYSRFGGKGSFSFLRV